MFMSLPKEVEKLIDRLRGYAARVKENPELAEMIKKTCLDEIELAEMLVAAKYRVTPLTTRLLFKMVLSKSLPNEVKNILKEELCNVY